ncbi:MULTISPECIES: efflux transporter outer membrane subunit [unclassified Caulobacter]|uniref:efflux transporter outer membrane subunit n=1 Tax=unclassified Caulobacter TaxID=2648921 RepID=UPI0006F7803C|nr:MULTISPECIES: efflux transporter outer membrane subunit [unclassified Caulobacter]KQV57293.1 RND transporter [Caulobacter sp. Root342]KQV66865.1 RND transporter [Caulobacter sp. Root343]
MRRAFAVLSGVGLLAACATPGPRTSPPPESSVTAPAAWRAPADVGQDAAIAAWWTAFGDPRLSDLVAAALARNADLGAAEARMREAEAQSRLARAALAPSVNGSVGAQKTRELNAFGAPSDTLAIQPQLQVAYELDLWGRLREASAAARASLQANRYARDAARLSVAAAVARAYVTLVSLDAQLTTAQATLASRQEATTRARRRAREGVTSDLELRQAEGELEAAAQRVPALELAVRRQENALTLLVGETPGPVARGSLATLTIPRPAAPLPSALLARRPDIAQAEAGLVAADASLDSARAAFLPQVRLSAAGGGLFVQHLDPVTVWSVGASVLAPIFDGGRLRAQSDAAAARRDQAAFAYRKAALTAFGEVESALEGTGRLAEQEAAANRQRAAAASALDHARKRYQAGYVAYLEELDAQRGLLATDLALSQIREARLQNAIALYQALGGGWTAGP